ncbi:MAG: plasmid replication protein, CyRepA1 family, partial [Spirulinaceae cyanobacterium]
IGPAFLIPELEIFATGGRKIYFALDEDSKAATINNVAAATHTTGKLLERLGCDVSVIRWNGEMGKGCDDFIYNQGLEAFEERVEASESLHSFWIRHQKRLTPKADYTAILSDESPYLEDLPNFRKNNLILIRAPKGAGKTYALAKKIAEHQYHGGKTLSLTHRQTLNNEQAKRFYLANVNDTNPDELARLYGRVLCFDSLLKVARDELELASLHGAWVILDEADQSLWHLLDSKTEVGKKRVLILQRLGEILRYVIATGGKIILSSADLDDVTVNFYKSLIGHKARTLTIIADDQRTKKTQLYNYTETNPGHLLADLEKHILAGGRPFICVSGQKDKSTWGTKTLEARLLALNPSLSILRIDQESLGDPDHSAMGCMERLNEVLPGYNAALASPAIETGVSIDIQGHFDSVWVIAYGVQTENSVRQALRRVREDVPRYFWANKTGMNWVGNRKTSESAIYASQQNQTRQHLALLAQAGGFFEGEELEEVSGAALKAWCQFAARINLEMKTYRASIIAGLSSEGYLIQDVGKDDELAFFKKKEIKQVRDTNYEVHCHQVPEAKDVPEEELQQLKDQKTKTPDQHRQVKKAVLKGKYGIEVTPSLVKRDDEGLFTKWRLDYYLTQGRKYLPHHDRRKAASRIFNGYFFSPDLNRGLKSGAILTLEALGFNKLRVSPKSEHRNTDPDLIEFKENCVLGAKAIKEWLGIKINPNSSPIVIFKQFLRKLGLNMPALRKEGSAGHQEQVYGPVVVDYVRTEEGSNKPLLDEFGHAIALTDEREEVFQVWLERDEKRLAEELADLEQKRIEQQRAKEIAEILGAFKSREDFQQIFYPAGHLIEGFTSYLMRQAIRLLDKAHQALVNQWLTAIEAPD